MSEAVNKLEDRVLQREKYGETADDDDDADMDELLDDEDEFLVHYREKRLQQLHEHMRIIEKNVKREGYGSLQKVDDESALMRVASRSPYCVIHFGLESFDKCRYMDEKLEALAERHLTTKFLRIEVENCPFLVSKLNIKVLPFLGIYKGGKEVERVVGFSKLGNHPNGFELSKLEELLEKVGVIGQSTRSGD